MTGVVDPAARWWRGLVPVGTADLSAEGHARLLQMTYERIRFSISAIPAVALPFIFYYRRFDEGPWLALWGLFYLAFAAFIWTVDRRYQRDRASLASGDLVARWTPRLNKIALVHGAGLSSSVAITAGHTPVEFQLMLHMALAGIIAANATHQTPVIGVFLRFMGAGCAVLVVMGPRTFPQHWQFFLPLGMLYFLTIYKHALTAHRFFVEQVRLEERSQHLATQFRAARDAAETALDDKNRFLSTASHDLRQPVHAMSMLVAALQAHNRDGALVPLLTNLKTSMDSLSLMFNALLNLSKLEAGRFAVEPRLVDIGSVLREVAALYREQAGSQGLQLRVRVPRRESSLVMVDAVLLRQGLVNLVHNALRFTRAGGVLLAARRRGIDWLIEVWDTGMGVATEEQARIFAPYYSGEQAWPINDPGHGLGLAVVARGAQLLNIEYGMRSRLGRGSCFWLKLRGLETPDSAAGTGMPEAPASARTTRKLQGRCLVLDDDPQVIAAWQTMLAAWNVEARCVTDGTQAFAALDGGFEPQAIFCDQRLRSGESGFEVLQALLARCPQASGAMISGEFDSTALHEAEREGYLVLRKPLDPDTLHDVLAQWLRADSSGGGVRATPAAEASIDP